MQERARTRARRSPEDPRYRAPIFTSRYCVRQLLKHGSIDERRRGSYVPEEDWWLARSRHNAFLSARRYLRRDEPAESKSSFDRQVRCSSSHLKRNFDTTSNNVKGESYFTRKRVIQTKQELMQRNLRCHSDGFDPTFPISTVRKDAKNVNRDGLNQTGCLNGNADDDELEEGQITPARGSFPSLSLSSSQPETGSNGSVSLIKYGENSCAINLTPTSKKKTKRSIDYSPSQFKKRKKRSSAESNIIVVCGQGSNRQQHHFLDNVKIASLLENANTRKDHQENDGRKRGLMLSNGLDLVSGKVGSEFNADVRMRIDGKFNTISAPIKFRCPAADEWKSLQQEDNAGEDKSIVHREDGQGSKSGDDSEMAGLSLQGDQIDQSKQRQDLSTYSDLTSQADLSLCIQHANVAGRNCWGVNCKRVEGSKGPVGALSATDKEIEKARDMGNSKDCGSLSKVDVMQGKMHEVITSVKENVSVPIKEAGLQVSKADSLFSEAVTNRVILPLHNCLPFDGNENVNSLGSVDSLISLTGLSLGLGISEAGPCKKERVKGVTDHLGVHTSDLPVKHVHPHINLVPASGNSEDIVPSQKFISTVGECGLQLDDIGEKRELGKPSFTEATCVSSLVPMTTAAANSSVFLDELDTILEAKQVDFMRATLNSDSLMAKLNVQQIDDMRCTMEPNISTALKDNYLNVLKQKKWGSSLDTDHPQSLSLPLFQTYKIVPSLLSWKRPASVAAHSRRINKKLQCLQTTQAFYSRSVDRFSMSHSAATSLGRSNFKWTKLIDKCTEKDNAEATIKAAAVEKWKGEGKDDHSGEDGKEKAKMLVACKAAQDLKLHAHKYHSVSYNLTLMRDLVATLTLHTRDIQLIPQEFSLQGGCPTVVSSRYIQAGNGNQPVRDPNTISCALASEKVRRRLHTVRSISSKKQQYCQFFTRFGKCNKEFGGICPYTHDSEKVVICTRFLKGNCVNMHCKLTHKVIPERMPDCSYFLLGVCTHESCPYRHVNVNPKAPICDGFLKGFCADNDKCKKKHTYVCPQYASNGECSERSICKFHHPRRKIESKLFSRVLKRNSKGRRYHFMTFEALRDFLSPSSVNLSGKEKKGAEEVSVENETAADYISLSASEEDITEDGMTEDNMGISQRCNAFSFEQGLQSDDSDMLLKPVLLLRR